MPENQTAWNSDNHGIKETVKENNQTSSATVQQGVLPCPGDYRRLPPLTTYPSLEQRDGAKMKNRVKLQKES